MPTSTEYKVQKIDRDDLIFFEKLYDELSAL